MLPSLRSRGRTYRKGATVHPKTLRKRRGRLRRKTSPPEPLFSSSLAAVQFPFDLQPIVRQADVGRKLFACLVVVDLMGNVRKPRLLRPDAARESDRFVETKMRRRRRIS